MNLSDKEVKLEPQYSITRPELQEELEKSEKRIKEFISLTFTPIRDEVIHHKVLLNGRTGRNGLIGSFTVLKYTSGIIFSCVLALLAKEFLL